MAQCLHILADFNLELWHIPEITNKADALLQRLDHDDRGRDNETIVALSDFLSTRAINVGSLNKQICKQQSKDQMDKSLQMHKVRHSNFQEKGFSHDSRDRHTRTNPETISWWYYDRTSWSLENLANGCPRLLVANNMRFFLSICSRVCNLSAEQNHYQAKPTATMPHHNSRKHAPFCHY